MSQRLALVTGTKPRLNIASVRPPIVLSRHDSAATHNCLNYGMMRICDGSVLPMLILERMFNHYRPLESRANLFAD